MYAQVVKDLEKIVGVDNVSTATTDKITHSYDATQQCYQPDVVVYAATTEEVAQVVRLANRRKIPVLPRGAGSGFTGGTLPVRGGIVLVLTRIPPLFVHLLQFVGGFDRCLVRGGSGERDFGRPVGSSNR